MGLAPIVVEEIFAIVKELHDRDGVSVLLAEQNARLALRHAGHGYVLENGRVVAHGTAAELRARPDVKEFYLGASTGAGAAVDRRRPAAAARGGGAPPVKESWR
jgi:branched-chain amino acid transport system ATP-binding protein